jgi:predicted nucleotide-binding protein
LARRPAPPQPVRPTLTIDQKRRCIERLRQRIAELEAFDPQSVQKRWPPEVHVIETAIEEALSAAFGHDTVEYNRYSRATTLDHGPVSVVPDYDFGDGRRYNDAHEARQYLAEGKQAAILMLGQAIKALEEEIADQEHVDAGATSTLAVAPVPRGRKVFVVHGHDEGVREAVARFLDQLGFQPIILHERPNKGRTIITKFREEAADIGFAVIVMTPDDLGKAANDPSEAKLRARQDVVFELGFFIRALGPDRVAALIKGEIERPSDFDGVMYISLDAADWRMKLGQEVQAAGYNIDWNKIMG